MKLFTDVKWGGNGTLLTNALIMSRVDHGCGEYPSENKETKL